MNACIPPVAAFFPQFHLRVAAVPALLCASLPCLYVLALCFGPLVASACGVNSEVFAWPVKPVLMWCSFNPPQRLYVGNLPHDILERDIRGLFLKFGRIRSVDLKTPRHGAPFAFIEFDGAYAWYHCILSAGLHVRRSLSQITAMRMRPSTVTTTTILMAATCVLSLLVAVVTATVAGGATVDVAATATVVVDAAAVPGRTAGAGCDLAAVAAVHGPTAGAALQLAAVATVPGLLRQATRPLLVWRCDMTVDFLLAKTAVAPVPPVCRCHR